MVVRPQRLAAFSVALGLGVLVATAVAFLPSLHNGFVDWDDPQTLVDNAQYRGLGPTQLRWMFTTTFWGHYQPLFWLSFAIDHLVSGASASGVHRTSLLLHAVNALLVYLVTLRLLAVSGRGGRGTVLAAACAALLWAVHPLRVEPVAWATGRGDLLVTLFSLLCIQAYLRAGGADLDRERRSRRSWILLALLACLAALLSRAVAMTLPLVLVLLDVVARRGAAPAAAVHRPRAPARSVWLEKVPFLALAIAAGILALHAKTGARSSPGFAVHGVAARCAQSVYGLGFYLWKTLLPVDLSPIYEIHLPVDPLAPRYVGSALLLGLVLLGLALLGRGRRAPWVAVAAYVVSLAPVIGITQAGNQEAADRYGYLASIPLFVLAGGGLRSLFERLPRPGRVVLGASVLGVLALLALLTERQLGVWRSSASLWAHAVEVAPGSSIAHNGIGFVLLEGKRYDEALVHLRRAIDIRPTNDMAHKNLWRLWREQGRRDELLAALRESARVWPTFVDAHFVLGIQLAESGDAAAAKTAYRRTLELRPDHSGALTNLGHIQQREGQVTEALASYEAATRADPSNAIAWRSWAVLLHAEGRRDEALDTLRQAFRLDPTDARARKYWQEWTGAPPP